MAERIVTGPVVVLPDDNGLIRYYYQGTTLPDGLDADRVRAAIDAGLVSETKTAVELTVDDLDVAAAGDRFRGQGAVESTTTLVGEPGGHMDGEAPPKTAPKEAWVDYAVDKGASREDADQATKQELIAAYGA